jgi:SpoVK/Ycf46/Vps4 family AAA+-type ATPase
MTPLVAVLLSDEEASVESTTAESTDPISPLYPQIEPELIRLWVLRILFRQGATHCFLDEDENSFSSHRVARWLGLEDLIAHFDKTNAYQRLQRMYEEAERQAITPPFYSEPLASNIARLQAATKLTDTECHITVFFLLINTDQYLYKACEWLDGMQVYEHARSIAQILGLPQADVFDVMSKQGNFLRTGLLTGGTRQMCNLVNHYKIISMSVAERMVREAVNPADLMTDFLHPSKPSSLTPADYTHIAQSFYALQHYLQYAVKHCLTGVNILIYGEPGTGKTELVRLMAQETGITLKELPPTDKDDNSIIGEERLMQLKFVQHFITGNTMLLFDEIQDVFDDADSFFSRSTAQKRKAEINNLLENNTAPVFWISNTVECLDNAFIRRFDMVLKLDAPPKSRRQQILQHSTQNLPVPPAALTRFAQHEQLSPAVMTRAARVVNAIQHNIPSTTAPLLLESLINNTLDAQGFKRLQKNGGIERPTFYKPSFINADTDLTELAAALSDHSSARLCLYGPSGTGKSAYAQWLAEKIDRPLHSHTLAQLLGSLVGETERNIAQAFHKAEQENAVLLLDEIDSILQDRQNANRQWEVTQVNEMLMQMETFTGIFIATTNRMDNLDAASLRRFDLKIKLDYLQPAQAWLLFLEQCREFHLQEPDASMKNRVDLLNALTPGDFAILMRQHRFRPFKDTNEVFNALKAECAMKQGQPLQGIGFIHKH